LFNIYSANDKKDDVGQEIHFSLGDGDAVLMPSARWGFFLSSLSLTPHTLTTLCPHVSNMNVLKRTHTHITLLSVDPGRRQTMKSGLFASIPYNIFAKWK
jgi:hypothetical protein